MPPRIHDFAWAEMMERRFDGPIPPTDPALAARPDPVARANLFQRLAADQRHALALRRRHQAAAIAADDPRLHQLAADLALYRRHGVAWREAR